MHPDKSRFLTLRIIFFAILMGVAVFLGIQFTVLAEREIVLQETLTNILMAAGAILYALGVLIPKFLIPVFPASMESFQRYQSIKIVQWAILEGGIVLNCVGNFITPNTATQIIIGIGIVVYLTRFPTENEMESWFPKSKF